MKEIWRCLTWTDPRYGGRLCWSIRALLRRSSWNMPELVPEFNQKWSFARPKKKIDFFSACKWMGCVQSWRQTCFRNPEVFSWLESEDGWGIGVESSCVELAAICSLSFNLVLFLFQRSWKSLSSSLVSYLCKLPGLDIHFLLETNYLKTNCTLTSCCSRIIASLYCLTDTARTSKLMMWLVGVVNRDDNRLSLQITHT